MSDPTEKEWSVYVIQSTAPRYGKRGNPLPGFHYVGCTTDVLRRLKQHNGFLVGGGKYTARHKPWQLRCIHGPYLGQSEALKAERALKRGLRGPARCRWTPNDSPWCRGLGAEDPRIEGINEVIQKLRER